MVADRKLSEAELFQVVGAGWKQQESEKRKKTFQEKLKGKPVFSMFLLFLIVLGCVFANVVANHDPSGFYLQNLNTPPGKEFIFGTDSLGRDIYSLIWYGGRVSLVIGLLGAAIITVIGVTWMHQRNSRAKGGLGSDAVYGNVRKYSDPSADPDPVCGPSGQ